MQFSTCVRQFRRFRGRRFCGSFVNIAHQKVRAPKPKKMKRAHVVVGVPLASTAGLSPADVHRTLQDPSCNPVDVIAHMRPVRQRADPRACSVHRELYEIVDSVLSRPALSPALQTRLRRAKQVSRALDGAALPEGHGWRAKLHEPRPGMPKSHALQRRSWLQGLLADVSKGGLSVEGDLRAEVYAVLGVAGNQDAAPVASDSWDAAHKRAVEQSEARQTKHKQWFEQLQKRVGYDDEHDTLCMRLLDGRAAPNIRRAADLTPWSDEEWSSSESDSASLDHDSEASDDEDVDHPRKRRQWAMVICEEQWRGEKEIARLD